MTREPTVFVVDDDLEVQDALRWLIESVALPVETFASAEGFVDAVGPDRPGCLVLDVRMPGMGGLRLLESLRTLEIRLPVIVLTGHGDVPLAVRAMKAGAIDFVEKPCADQDLLDRIYGAMQRDAELRAETARRAAISEQLEALTPREREILERLVKGQANKVIAAELDISERTVESHRRHIKEKLQVRSLAELAQIVLKHRGGE
ncbi:MAG: response regulator [Chromatiaceae bacterium]|jgi:two-component system response regulator FixJ|nr:response regulator [Chromatiaceae bacterium]